MHKIITYSNQILLDAYKSYKIQNKLKKVGDVDFQEHVDKFIPVTDEIKGLSVNKIAALDHMVTTIGSKDSVIDIKKCLNNPEITESAHNYLVDVCKSFKLLDIKNTDTQKKMFEQAYENMVMKEQVDFAVDQCIYELGLLVTERHIGTLSQLIFQSSQNNEVMCFVFQKTVCLIFGLNFFLPMVKDYYRSANYSLILTDIRNKCYLKYKIINKNYLNIRNTIIKSTFVGGIVFTTIMFTFNKDGHIKLNLSPQVVEAFNLMKDQCVPTGEKGVLLSEIQKSVSQTTYSISSIIRSASLGVYFGLIQPIGEILIKKVAEK